MIKKMAQQLSTTTGMMMTKTSGTMKKIYHDMKMTTRKTWITMLYFRKKITMEQMMKIDHDRNDEEKDQDHD